MANIDPTGLLPALVQRLFSLIEGETRNLVNFKPEFQDLAKNMQSFERSLQEISSVSIEDGSTLSDWVKEFQACVISTDPLIRDCEAAQAAACWSCNIKSKRKLLKRIRTKKKQLVELNSKVSILTLQRVLAQGSHSGPGYLKQVLPDTLISTDDDSLNKVIETLIRPSRPAAKIKWVGIWGQGGSGKTILAKQVNNSKLVYNWFKGQVYFLTIGGAADERGSLEALCSLAGCRGNASNDELKNTLYTKFSNQRTLLILDDVWTAGFLELLNVVDDSNGSRILVTTRVREALLEKHAEICTKDLLSESCCKKLFYNHAFGVDKECPGELQECAEEIIKLCKGLPLALAIVGSAMAVKQKVVRQWQREVRKIRKDVFPGKEMRGLFEYSYRQLPSKKEQECFLTMLSFREDTLILGSQLVPWWRGENLIGCLYEDGWEEAEAILETLVNRSLIVRATRDGSERYGIDYCGYRVHDVILELGLDHLLKKDSDLEEHERGCLFLHHARFSSYVLDEDQAQLRRMRKLALDGGNTNSTLVRGLKKADDFPGLKVLSWRNFSEMDEESFAWLVSRSRSLEVLIFGNKELSIVVNRIVNRTTLPSSLRCLIDEDRTYVYTNRSVEEHSMPDIVLQQHLPNLEWLDWKFSGGEHFELDLKKLSCLSLVSLSPTRCSLDVRSCTNLRFLNIKRLGKHLGPWDSSSQVKGSFPQLEYVNVEDDLGDFSRWVQMLNDSPNLRRLSLEGPFEKEPGHLKLPALMHLSLKNLSRSCYYLDEHKVVRLHDLVSMPPPLEDVTEMMHAQYALHNEAKPPIITASIITAPKLQSLHLSNFGMEHFKIDDRIHLKELRLTSEGQLPLLFEEGCMLFPSLEQLTLHGDFEEFPRLGRDVLPELTYLHLDMHSQQEDIQEVVFCESLNSSFGFRKMKRLIVHRINFTNLPEAVITSPSMEVVDFSQCKRLKRLVLEHEGREIECVPRINFSYCPEMTMDGLPEVLKHKAEILTRNRMLIGELCPRRLTGYFEEAEETSDEEAEETSADCTINPSSVQ